MPIVQFKKGGQGLDDALLGLVNPLVFATMLAPKGKSLLNLLSQANKAKALSDFTGRVGRGGMLSSEELARRQNFFFMGKEGKISPLFKQRDVEFPLRPGDAILSVDPEGKLAVASSMGLGKDKDVLGKLGPRLLKFLELQRKALGR